MASEISGSELVSEYWRIANHWVHQGHGGNSMLGFGGLSVVLSISISFISPSAKKDLRTAVRVECGSEDQTASFFIKILCRAEISGLCMRVLFSQHRLDLQSNGQRHTPGATVGGVPLFPHIRELHSMADRGLEATASALSCSQVLAVT